MAATVAPAIGTTLAPEGGMNAMDASPTGSARTPRPRGLRSESGFTLIEMLVVAAVAVIISSIGVAQITTAMERLRLQESASVLEGKLQEARLQALKRNRTTWLSIDAAAGTFIVQTNDAGGNPVDIGLSESLRTGVSFTAAPAAVTFDTLGRLGATQTITFTDPDGNTRTVTVAVTGTTRVS